MSYICKCLQDGACATPGSSVVYIGNPYVNADGGMHQLADKLRGRYPNLTTVVYGGRCTWVYDTVLACRTAWQAHTAVLRKSLALWHA